MYTDFIVDFITQHQAEPFIAYYPMALTHAPFVPTPHSKNFSSRDKFSSNRKYFGDPSCTSHGIIYGDFESP